VAPCETGEEKSSSVLSDELEGRRGSRGRVAITPPGEVRSSKDEMEMGGRTVRTLVALDATLSAKPSSELVLLCRTGIARGSKVVYIGAACA
jgi:hypothetical protein